MNKLVLGSSSPYRKQVLEKLGVAFETASPEIDETPLLNETAQSLVQRLSEKKAKAVAAEFPQALIIGSDQVAVLDGQILGKPHNHENAFKQLRQASGRRVDFYTGLCLYNSQNANQQYNCIPFSVYFRKLSDEQIERYLQHDKPYNCAGSFRSEALGISLFTKMQGDDPNSLMGLPLIELIEMLANEGIYIP